MYRLMHSEKFTFEHPRLGHISTYRQRLIGQYGEVRIALEACHKANADGRHRFYVLNEAGQENFGGTWID
ncbi:MAG: hypothetical protein PVJ03_03140 [Chromatiaceae bacterium]|jgi:hypothetical protein